MSIRSRMSFLLAALLALACIVQVVMARQGPTGHGPARPLDSAREAGRLHLTDLALRHGLAGPHGFREKAPRIDRLGMAHVRVQQTHGGVPVLGGEAIVHLRRDGSLFRVTDDLAGRVSLETRPALTARQAEEAAVAAYGCGGCLTEEPRSSLWILRHEGRDRLAWRVRLRREDGSPETALPVLFIDARAGTEIWRYDDLQTVAGAGQSLYSGEVPVESYPRFAGFYLEDIGRKLGTFDSRSGYFLGFRFRDTDNLWDAPVQRAGVDVHYAMALYHDYLMQVHGRDGLDGAGGPGGMRAIDGITRVITSRVHYGNAYNNAFWNGRTMSFGDGDGSLFSPLVPVDIVVHEATHAVTQFEAGLLYFNEPGALNESWSDVFGALGERRARGETAGTWKIGEECFTPANGTADALRHMDDPHLASNRGFTDDDDPDHYSERFTGLADNGGVHVNSGIANKAFHLLAAGGAHHLGGSMAGIGADAAALIWFEALENYMTSSTDFAGAREATLNAAAALFGEGSVEEVAVGDAWCLVGVGADC